MLSGGTLAIRKCRAILRIGSHTSGASREAVQIINDFDGNVANFWRAMKYWTVLLMLPPGLLTILTLWRENVLKEYDAMRKNDSDPEYFDPKLPGYWDFVRKLGQE